MNLQKAHNIPLIDATKIKIAQKSFAQLSKKDIEINVQLKKYDFFFILNFDIAFDKSHEC